MIPNKKNLSAKKAKKITEGQVDKSLNSSNKKKYFDESGEEISAEVAAKNKKSFAKTQTAATDDAIKNLDKRWYEVVSNFSLEPAIPNNVITY